MTPNTQQSDLSAPVTLKVLEANPQDAGKSIARLDPEILKGLGLNTGDVVAVRGDRRTVASVYPSYPQDAGSRTIRIDGATRRNAGIGIDDHVEVEPLDATEAATVRLAPIQAQVGPFNVRNLVTNHLVARPLVKGDLLFLDVMGHRVALRVVDHTPRSDAVIVSPQTKLEIADEPVGPGEGEGDLPRVSYEDIGGLGPQIRKVREMIELPLRHPEVFGRLGVEPPKGVLLHGPPGTGKTLLAKAVANETQAAFYTIGGPEIMSKFHGQSEENLREVFDKAKENAPAIIFIDELDSIAPKRDEVTGEVERRVVAQLLSLMDGLEDRGKVVVIAATNRPDSVDVALRRPGRFDREIEIGVPDRDARLEVLHVHTRGMPLSDDVDLEAFASRTHGYVGADLASLAREAAMHAVRRLLPEIDLEADEVPADVLDKLEVTGDDLEVAFTELAPSAMREVLVQRPETRWDDVGGLDEPRQELVEAIEWPLKYGRLYDHMKAETPKGVLLHGPPGTGKTLLAKALARESGVNFISVKGPELLSKWVGESERGVREVFRKARQAAPCIVFFDEIEALAPARGHRTGDSGVGERVVSQFLTELDGLETLRGVVVIGATNRLDLVDPALTRPGRFDRLVEVPLPDAEARTQILSIHTRDLPLADDVDVATYVDRTDGWSGAEIAAMAHEASLLAVRGFVASGADPENQDALAAARVTRDHLEAAYAKVRGRGGPRDAHTGDQGPPVTAETQ